MQYDDLTDLQLDLISARLLGHSAKLEAHWDDKVGHYVEVTDLHIKGDDALVNASNWSPSSDETQMHLLCALTGIQAFESDGRSWMAGMPSPRGFTYGRNKHQAVLKCFVRSVYPKEIPDEMLKS